MRFLYTLVLYLITPIVVIRLYWKSLKVAGYRQRMNERFGYYDPARRIPSGCIWIHAVSVGETQATLPLMNELMKTHPDACFVFTTTTPTGAQRVADLYGDKVTHVFFPYDLPGAVDRFLKVAQPRIGIIMETELWPNLFFQCKKKNIPILVANARMSEKSSEGYKKFSSLVTPTLANVALIAAQSNSDAQRFEELARGSANIEIMGSLKFDTKLPASLFEQAQVLRLELMHHRPVWIAASTHEGEDEPVLRAFRRIRQQLPETILILVPRHPERTMRIMNLCRKHELPFARRSKNERIDDDVCVYLGDTFGDLPLLFAISDVAFVGGSLEEIGGHNLLEPAAVGVPVVVGPHMFNFQDITNRMTAVNAVETVTNEKELSEVVLKYLQDANLRHSIGENGRQFVEQNRGATKRLVNLIESLI